MIIKTVKTKVKAQRSDRKRSEDRKWRDIQLKKLRAEKYSQG
jgi:hypothetical protein